MATPLFSIIVPTFNSANTLEKCIKSILCQAFEDFEILIIDGASNDNTIEILNDFNDARIKVFSEQDKGIYDAMNKGIAKANGEWLYFLGSDDTLYDDFTLEDIYKTIKKTNPAIIYGNVKILGNAGWASDGQVYDGKFDLTELLNKNIAHQCIFYSKQTIKNEAYNLKYKVCADYDLNLRLFSKFEFKYFDRIIANFRGGGYSVVSTDNDFSIAEAILKYFFSTIWKKEFSIFKNEIKLNAKKESHLIRKIYFYLVYFKHRLFYN